MPQAKITSRMARYLVGNKEGSNHKKCDDYDGWTVLKVPSRHNFQICRVHKNNRDVYYKCEVRAPYFLRLAKKSLLDGLVDGFCRGTFYPGMTQGRI